MVNEEKNKLLTNLLTLKSGIKLMNYYETLCEIEVEEETFETEDLDDAEASKKAGELGVIVNEIASKERQKVLDEETEWVNSHYRDYEKKKKKYKVLLSICLSLLVLGLPSFVVGCIFAEKPFGVLLILLGILFLGLFIGFIFITKSAKRRMNESKRNIPSSTTLNQKKEDLDYSLTRIEESKQKIEQSEIDINTHKQALAKLQKNSQRIVYKQIIEAIHNVLVEKFSTLLVEDDWYKLDYIIFCLQTKRADTLKEALILADQEFRFKELEEII